MMEFLSSLSPFWFWLLAALICLLTELVLLPVSGFLLSIAFAAALSAVIFGVFPASWNVMSATFASLSIISSFAWWKYLHRNGAKKKTAGGAEPLNERTQSLIGYRATLSAPLQNGRGRLKIQDTTWSVAADQDYPAGATVKVVAADGIVLKIIKDDSNP